MHTDNDLERRLRDVLRQSLDDEHGPDPAWDDSPAAGRVNEEERRRPNRWTLRVLAVAALITIGGGAALILGTPDDPPLPPAANGWIAYGMHPETGGDEDIWFVSLDQEPRRVIGSDTDTVDQLCPAFSPDGRSLAYGEVDRSGATPTTAVVVAAVNSEGDVSEGFRVEAGETSPCPVWSPDGARIAFGVPRTSVINPTQGAEGSEVWVVTVADHAITVLPDLLATDLEFSPDGSVLGIASGRDAVVPGNQLHDGRLHLYELATGATRALEGTLGALTFTWSPDGERIAYSAIADETGDAGGELRVVDLTTEEERVLTAPYGAVHGIGPVWSPDGESIVYQRCVGGYAVCSGERNDVVLVWPDDLSADGVPREEIIPLFDRPTENTEQAMTPYWVTWSPDGAYLMFTGWTRTRDPLLGVVPVTPGSPSEVLVTEQDVSVYPAYEGGPFVPIQSWGRRPADPASATPTPEQSAAEPSPSGAGTSHLLVDGEDGGVPITVRIDAPDWNGDPNRGVLCWGDPDTCAGPPDGAGIYAFQGREYLVYGDACHRPPPTPDVTATTVDQLIDAVTGDRQVHRWGSPPENIVIGGYAGRTIHLVAVPPPGDCDFDETRNVLALFGLPGEDPARVSQGPSQVEEVSAVDVDGLIVVLVGAYYADTPEHVVDEMRAIISSATFDR